MIPQSSDLAENESRKRQQKIQQLLKTQIYNPNTNTLDLYNTESKTHWKDIVAFKDWTNLQRLELNACNINSKNITYLTNSKWNNLKSLSLSSNIIKCQGISLLCQAQLPVLQALWLFGCQMGNKGAQILSKGHWPRLSKLHAGTNKIGMNGSRGLVLNGWKQLTLLRVSENQRSMIIAFSYMLNPSQKANIEVSVQTNVPELTEEIIKLVYEKSRNQQ